MNSSGRGDAGTERQRAINKGSVKHEENGRMKERKSVWL